MQVSDKTLLALDIGERRIGVARANMAAGFAHPLTTLDAGPTIFADIRKLAEQEHAAVVVAGLPRGLDGQTTEQTKSAKAFIAKLKVHLDIPIVTIDEALTSVKAEAELNARGKAYNKADVDALAATYILEDFMNEHNQYTGEAYA